MTAPDRSMANALANLVRDRERTELERALDAFVFGRGSPEDMATIARECRTEFVQIHFRRRQPPPPGQRVRLPFTGDHKRGPLSAEGRPVIHASGKRWGGLYAGWWSVADLREAAAPRRRQDWVRDGES